ncbi:hypothetical protein AB0K51_00215 [Kitasatospora sp. NPDC049285]|uniref:hypothetical protein n=1 Tax=Kitasatospora sp. NPDC049285 TaxID=3157096 RepID=UPI00343CFE36
MARIRALAAAVLLPLLLPLQLAQPILKFRFARLRAARAGGDRGAISIELALAVIVVVAIAGAIIVLIKGLASNVESKIPGDVPAANNT